MSFTIVGPNGRGKAMDQAAALGKLGAREVVHKQKGELTPTDQKCTSVAHWVVHLWLVPFVALGSFLYHLFVKLPKYLFTKQDPAREQLQNDFRKAFRDHIVNFEQQFKLRQHNGEYTPEAATFMGRVTEWRKEIPELAQDPDALRSRLVELSQSDYYQRNVATDSWAIDFVQQCALAIESAPAAHSFREYGKTRSGIKSDLSLTDFTEKLLKAREQIPNRDNPLNALCWGLNNPLKWWKTWGDTRAPVGYDGYQDQAVFEIEEGGLRYKFTPGITGENSLVEHCIIPALEKQGKRWFHITHQSPHDTEEALRIQAGHRWAGDVFQQIVISTDTPMKKGEEAIRRYLDWNSTRPSEFAKEYEALLRGKNDEAIRDPKAPCGIYIPESLLSKEELNAVFDTAREIFVKCVPQGTIHGTPLKEFMCRNVNSLLNWAVLKKIESKYPGAIFSQACKQNVDRGPFEYIEMKLNELILSGDRIAADTANLLIGIALGRADYAMNRSPEYKRRVHAFVNRMQFIAKNTSVVQKELSRLQEQLVNPTRSPSPASSTASPSSSSLRDA